MHSSGSESRRKLFLAALEAAENALLAGDLDHAALCLPPESEVWIFQDDPEVQERFWVAHAVATDRHDA